MARNITPRFKGRARRKTYFREWRKHRGLTLEKAADRAGMTAGNLSAMERGTQNYTQAGLESLAFAYNCDPGQLLMVNPGEQDAIWSIWETAKDGQKRAIVEHAKLVLKTGT